MYDFGFAAKHQMNVYGIHNITLMKGIYFRITDWILKSDNEVEVCETSFDYN